MSSLRFFYLTEGLQLFTLIPMAKYRLDCDIWEREKIIFAANSVHHVLCQTSPKFIRFHPIFSLWTIVLKQDFKQEVWAFYTRLQTIFGLRDDMNPPYSPSVGYAVQVQTLKEKLDLYQEPLGLLVYTWMQAHKVFDLDWVLLYTWSELSKKR